MNTEGSVQINHNNLSIFLLGAILNIMAVIDYNSLLDYSLKAVIGGLIWLGFKIAGEYFTKRINTTKKD